MEVLCQVEAAKRQAQYFGGAPFQRPLTAGTKESASFDVFEHGRSRYAIQEPKQRQCEMKDWCWCFDGLERASTTS